MQKSLNIHFPTHISLKFNHKVTRAIVMTHNVTIPDNLFTFQSTMNNINGDFVAWEKVIQKPRGNILTDDLRITVSRMVDARHVPQCRNQMNDDTNKSFSLAVINEKDNYNDVSYGSFYKELHIFLFHLRYFFLNTFQPYQIQL